MTAVIIMCSGMLVFTGAVIRHVVRKVKETV